MTPKKFASAFKKLGSVKEVWRKSGLGWSTVHKVYKVAVAEGLVEAQPMGRKPNGDQNYGDRHGDRPHQKNMVMKAEGQIKARKTFGFPLPPSGEISRYLFTSAQNDTKLFKPFWANLLAFAEHYDAEIFISRFLYIKAGLGAGNDKAQWVKRPDLAAGGRGATWPKEIESHFLDERVTVAPGLVFCGEMNILPTAGRPLSGLETYTGRASGIFPHVKIAMESIPSGKYENTKFNYTTGTVTQRNYIQRKAGLKGEFHHAYGALLVEVDSEGNWWCRQINADSTGTFYDLDLRVRKGIVTEAPIVANKPSPFIEGITWGDIHVRQMDPTARAVTFGAGGMLDTLRPKHQFLHDVLDFRSRSHHNAKNPHVLYQRHVEKEEDVRDECVETAKFLAEEAFRPWCKNIVVDSNHHQHIGRWLREQDGRWDPINAEFWLEMNKRVYECIRFKRPANYLKIACEAIGDWNLTPSGGKNFKRIRFLDEDESFIICADAHGGIECGMHGHNGPSGARGSTRNLIRMGRKFNKGHDHKATLMDGGASSGTKSIPAPDWTHGPSASSDSDIITYRNGKRAILTTWAGQYAAGRGAPEQPQLKEAA